MNLMIYDQNVPNNQKILIFWNILVISLKI